jgi:hypothetical protein
VIRSLRSWRSWASTVIVAIGRASSLASEIGSPVTSQKPYSPVSIRRKAASIFAMSLRWRSRVKLDRPVGLAGGAVGDIGFADRAALQLRHRVARFAQNLILPAEQLVAEIAKLRAVHELLVRAGAIDIAAQPEAMIENFTESRRHNPSAPSARPDPSGKHGISSAGPESPGFFGLYPSAPIGEPEHQHKSLKRRSKPILESAPERDIFADPPPHRSIRPAPGIGAERAC